MLVWLFWFSRYGFDFTDEGFYLNWLSQPFNYSASSTQFGFVYHPLYNALAGNVAALRQANIVLTAGLGTAAAFALFSRVFDTFSPGLMQKLAISAALGTSALLSLVFAGMWLPTPSYNTLALQGLLVTVAGLFAIDAKQRTPSIVAWVAIGVGGWLVFMAKPTSAAALALAVAIYLVLTATLRLVPIIITVVTALGLVALSAVVIDGSIGGFVARLTAGARIATMLDGNYAFKLMFRLEGLTLDAPIKVVLFAIVAVVTCVIFVASIGLRRHPSLGVILASIFVFGGFAAIALMLPLGAVPGPYRGLLLCVVPLGGVMAALLLCRLDRLQHFRWKHCLLVTALLFLPYAYAFGTGNNYWIPIAAGGVFFVYAGAIVLGMIVATGARMRSLLFFGISVQIVSVLLVNEGLSTPYRQPTPLDQNDTVAEVGMAGSTLVLAGSHANYLATASRIAAQHGFTRGMPMIDLSGHSPGLVYAMGGNAVGMAWTLGGYPGSIPFATENLRRVPCSQLAAAWILTEPDNQLRVPSTVLSSFGADPDNDLETVGTVMTPDGKIQHLQKPKRNRDAAVAACEFERRRSEPPRV